MVWSHRVIKRLTRTPDGEPEVIYGVYETFYNGKGEVTAPAHRWAASAAERIQPSSCAVEPLENLSRFKM